MCPGYTQTDGQTDATKCIISLASRSIIIESFQPCLFQGGLKEPKSEADVIAIQAHRTFTEVYGSVAEEMMGRKVLAAIIMKTESDKQGTTVSLGTGTVKRSVARFVLDLLKFFLFSVLNKTRM